MTKVISIGSTGPTGRPHVRQADGRTGLWREVMRIRVSEMRLWALMGPHLASRSAAVRRLDGPPGYAERPAARASLSGVQVVLLNASAGWDDRLTWDEMSCRRGRHFGCLCRSGSRAASAETLSCEPVWPSNLATSDPHHGYQRSCACHDKGPAPAFPLVKGPSRRAASERRTLDLLITSWETPVRHGLRTSGASAPTCADVHRRVGKVGHGRARE